MPKKIAILQSNYIPWKGYIDMIASVDEFILYDDMQYTRRDWRNRNKIITPNGAQWLTVPVKVKGKYLQNILETEIDGDEWRQVHWRSLESNYRRAPHFEEIAALFKPLYLDNTYTHLSVLNRTFLQKICTYLGITTKISCSSDYKLIEGKTERLVDLCLQAGGTEYTSGPAAKDYIQQDCFDNANVKLVWFDYVGYPEYTQLWGGEFIHPVSIMDMLFNCGKDTPRYMRYVNTSHPRITA